MYSEGQSEDGGRYVTKTKASFDLSDIKEIEALFSLLLTLFVVFMLGGGCYAEYQNLLEAAAAKTAAGTSRSVIYGSTEMFNAEGFLTQLAKLGKKG